LPSETMIWQPEFTDKTLSRKPGAVQGVSRKYNESSQDMHYQVIPEGIKLSPRIRIYNISDNKTS
ncbi:hypothetical protein, partial [Escherichia coli]|uniref:hypothetical protein n=1 Tax=Escherichia coli TaxID=562 RepID=UPI003CF40691